VGPRRRLIVVVVLGVVAAAGWLAVPRRFEVDGVSMGPELLPGDVVRTGVWPALDRLRPPRRFDRWVLQATDGLALKRVVGLPGEEVSIADGDLVVDGAVVLKGPRLLAEQGVQVESEPAVAAPHDGGWSWSSPVAEILDDADFDVGSRRFAPVRDVGLAAVVDVRHASAANPSTVHVTVGDEVFALPLAAPGRHAVAAGRLDGRIVVATWPVAATAGSGRGRSCLPPGPPAAWDVAVPWPRSGEAADTAPMLGIAAAPDAPVTLVDVGRWRDVAWWPAADGRTSWRLDADEIFVLGDHPPASTDSRRWGPIEASALRQRIVGAR